MAVRASPKQPALVTISLILIVITLVTIELYGGVKLSKLMSGSPTSAIIISGDDNSNTANFGDSPITKTATATTTKTKTKVPATTKVDVSETAKLSTADQKIISETTKKESTTQIGNIINATFHVDDITIVSKMELTPVKRNKEIIDFEYQDGAVIAVKIQGPPHWPQLKQSMCLLTKAYNFRPKYDIIVFSSVPVPEEDIAAVKSLVAPANFTVWVDDQTLEEQVEAMTPHQRNVTFQRCNVTSVNELKWGTRCTDVGMITMPLAYNWQCEFRSKHLWRHRALKPYKYMLWYDSDAMATEVWKHDPIAFFIRNNLTLLFDNFPQGTSRGADMQQRIEQTFGKRLCSIFNYDGRLHAKHGTCWENTKIQQVHGFFHITDLDFYRSDIVRKWQDNLIGDTKFSRRLDDQIGVTVPAVMLAGNTTWDMRNNGVRLNVWHNGMIDGKEKWRGGGYKKWWATESKEKFPEAVDVCSPHVVNSGR